MQLKAPSYSEQWGIQISNHSLALSHHFLSSLSVLQTLNQATSPALSACPSTPFCPHRVISCLRSSSRLCLHGPAWTSAAPSASPAAQLSLPAMWRWRPMSAGTRECLCMMGGGRSGTPAPFLSTSYLRGEENTCDWFTGLRSVLCLTMGNV